jgi:nicotinamide-nucleotide amidase
VARALADGARERLGADVGVGVTGIAGPGGGTPEKPVGTVWFSVVAPVEGGGEVSGEGGGEVSRLTRRVQLPGGREDVRDRATTVALHMVRRALLGEGDEQGGAQEVGSAADRQAEAGRQPTGQPAAEGSAGSAPARP